MGAQYTSISVSFSSKRELDAIKSEIGVKTYDKALQYLLKSCKKGIASTAGCDPDLPSFKRETGGDSHRLSY
ncbi:MAG: hypothetical protein WC367_01370 [Methanoregula sp.]|jgi:hypothetical protein